LDPKTLADYLAVLPPTAFQIELTSGDFTIKLNLAPPGEPEPVDHGDAIGRDGSVVPEELRPFYPQLRNLG
jgi:hypothetical protein